MRSVFVAAIRNCLTTKSPCMPHRQSTGMNGPKSHSSHREFDSGSDKTIPNLGGPAVAPWRFAYFGSSVPVAILVFILMSAGIAWSGQPASAPVTVVTSNTVLADLVANVGGSLVRVRSLAPAGTDPHTFQPTPEAMKLLADARLVFFNGAGLEEWWTKTVRSIGRGTPVVELSKGLATLDISDASSEKQPRKGEPDPHLWLDPTLTKVYVERIRDGLVQIDPSHAGAYAQPAAAYNRQLDELDGWIRAQVDQVPPARRKLVTFHDAFQYFARRYGFTIRGFVVASPGKEPSAKSLAELARRIKAEQIPAVFSEADFNPKLLQVLAKDAGVKVITNLYDGSLTNGPPAATYLDLMRHDVTTIVEALK